MNHQPNASRTDVTTDGAKPTSGQNFGETRWTLVLRARGGSGEARAALSELCEFYYGPVLRFLRRERRDEDSARELTQEFFARVLAGAGFDGADPNRGRFRSYLLGALKHFLCDHRAYQCRHKRGGGTVPESLDATGTTMPDIQPVDHAAKSPDACFDREWALNVMARALDKLQMEMASLGRSDHFAVLKPWLMGDAPSLTQASAAGRLGISEGAVKVAVHRLRKRFREMVREEIAQTLRDPGMVDEELGHLIAALS